MKKLLLVIILIAAVVAFFKFGRFIWSPVMSELKGRETIESIHEKYGASVLERLRPGLQKAGFDRTPDRIMFIALKEERVLELWGIDKGGWKKIKDYPFTGFSGVLGPKLREGDRQIPEGIYSIEFLNPNSSYHLSLKVDYPNDFDRSKASADNRTGLGTDIFIHGKNNTIGCIPVGDEGIEELFVLSAKAINKGIKVIISPRDFRVNSEHPSIEGITWEDELYEVVKKELATSTEGVGRH